MVFVPVHVYLVDRIQKDQEFLNRILCIRYLIF